MAAIEFKHIPCQPRDWGKGGVVSVGGFLRVVEECIKDEELTYPHPILKHTPSGIDHHHLNHLNQDHRPRPWVIR